ncbi:hypothetical protein KO506_01545 [Polaribacter vadi]|uniref:DUF6095 family protein n=1 Tax=Polaribacter TaxID=52959 RepID=UPI001C0981BB|nr:MULTISPECIES: DUF6095 family protein [Polaribacter]MBU3010084.1 hypothetical protein [Polaribacter vadi]MDO6739891.1 DUF6095 family protein [Polaribacter sp. 1_MG-2023]
MSTDVNLLGKGLKYLGILIFLFIAAPISLTMGFKALKKFENTPNAYLSYLILLLAIVLTFFAIYFAFKTFKTIQRALFNK